MQHDRSKAWQIASRDVRQTERADARANEPDGERRMWALSGENCREAIPDNPSYCSQN